MVLRELEMLILSIVYDIGFIGIDDFIYKRNFLKMICLSNIGSQQVRINDQLKKQKSI